MTDTPNRYLRQTHAFPSERRLASALAVFGGECNPAAATALIAGAAAMGVPAVGSDFHGPWRPRPGHWLTGELPDLAARINGDVGYEYLDPEMPAEDFRYVAEGRENTWAAVLTHDPAGAREVLEALAGAGFAVGVLLVLAGPGGIVVDRLPSPASALERVRSLGSGGVPAGPPELAIAAAGLVLNEIMLAGAAGAGVDVAAPRTIGFYSLHRPRRVTVAGEGPEELFAEAAATPAGEAASFAGRDLVMVGAGALANWAVIPLAVEGPARMVIYDGDGEVAPHNINRQVLLVDGVGQGRPKADVLAEQLASLDPDGIYEPVARFVRAPDDLRGLGDADALLCVPDNDEARLTCDDARRAAGVLFATAGSSAVGGQVIVRCPSDGCLRCLGLGRQVDAADDDGQSCSQVADDAVVSSNMVAAGLTISELREALAGRTPANVRFAGDSARGNRLVRMISGTRCPHVAAAKAVAS